MCSDNSSSCFTWLLCKPKSGSKVLFTVPQMEKSQKHNKTCCSLKRQAGIAIECLVLVSFSYESFFFTLVMLSLGIGSFTLI